MGDFHVHIKGVGGHGCDRAAKQGEAVTGCGGENCPDCLTKRFVADLARRTTGGASARYTHWPDQESEVVDEIHSNGLTTTVTRIKGAFKARE